MEIVVTIDPSLFHTEPNFGAKIMEILEANAHKDLVPKVKVCVTQSQIEEERSIELYVKNGENVIYHLMLFRTAEETSLLLNEEQHHLWVGGLRSKRTISKLSLFVFEVDQFLRSDTKRFQFERDLTKSQIDQDFQSFLVRKDECFDRACNFVYRYVRAMAKDDGKGFNHREKDGFSSVKVDHDAFVGLMKLWHQQLLYISPPVQRKHLSKSIPSPATLFDMLRSSGDLDNTESTALNGVTGSKDVDMILTKLMTSEDGELMPKAKK